MTEKKLIKTFTDENFQENIKKGVVLVDFNAVWCSPCRMLAPILQEVAEHFEDKIVVAKVDIDSEEKTSAKFQITSVPTIVLFKEGKELNRLLGLRDFDSIKEFVETAF